MMREVDGDGGGGGLRDPRGMICWCCCDLLGADSTVVWMTEGG